MSLTTYDYRLIACALLALINLIVFAMYGFDKWRAKRDGWRIPERTLLLSAVVGGLGAFSGMLTFHHKTRKWYFRLVCALCAAVHALAVLRLLFS